MRIDIDIDLVLESYVETALWSSTDNADDSGGEPLDENYTCDDIAADTLDAMYKDCEDFCAYASKNIAASGLDAGAIGHNFWLNRNGHGAGFWDLGLGKVGEALSADAETFGSYDLYVGDDGKVYGS